MCGQPAERQTGSKAAGYRLGFTEVAFVQEATGNTSGDGFAEQRGHPCKYQLQDRLGRLGSFCLPGIKSAEHSGGSQREVTHSWTR